ncbi:protein phosphatase 2C domain-containing protein [Microbacterium sp. HD4P20]|uniref:PP2C family protein-serine/threonine phosphatase n=1 Tax=Microbacterium sp. HD4P20 TaxID=2864874 RepID=UPI0020A263D2|nr:protein phosphatase 2C domain-containing protein [Microbacterium sp. HD4P20]MCP2637102.1 protein phosphatase 2C domain-containing protein [Microbacterium sp. HD4P20]
MMEPHVVLRAAAVSDVGAHRPVNQDAAFTAAWGAAVADGVGGGPAGDFASAAFVHRLAAGRPTGLGAEQLAASVRAANWDLRAHVERDPALTGMATTFTGIFVAGSRSLLLAHTGDSRAYRLRDGVLTRQTRDDSLVQVLVDRGIVAEEDAASHPRRNVITASLSGAERDAPTIVEHEPRAGDRWLLCSDGLTDYVPDADIHALLTAHDRVEDAATAGVGLALDAGTFDNVTVIVADVVPGRSTAAPPHETTFYGAARARFMEGLESA